MTSCQRPLFHAPRQLSLFAEVARPSLSPDERREVVALIASLLIEAIGAAAEAADDRR